MYWEGNTMTNLNSSPLFQTFAVILVSWLLIGIAGKDIFNDLLKQMSYAFDGTFSNFAGTIRALADRLTRYFDATDIEIVQRINANWNKVASEVTANDIEQNDKPILANRIKIEKMTGAILGFFALLAVFYGNALQGAANFSLLFPQSATPALFDIPMVYQLILIVFGVTISNGLHVSDILGISNYTNSYFGRGSGQRKLTEKIVLGVRVFNLILTIIIFIFIAIKDTTINSFAFSFLIVPLLITAFTSLDSISGMYLILSLPLYLFSVSAYLLLNILQFSTGVIRAYINILWILFDNTLGIIFKIFRGK